MARSRCPVLAFVASLLTPSLASAQVSVGVDPAADQRTISPLIYGMNFASASQITQARLAVTRWGGNRTTRYNYLVDADNSAADYFFENLPGCWSAAGNYCSLPPADPREESGANAFLTSASADGIVALFTVPTMGWVAKTPQYGHPFDCSCTGAGQDAYDPYDTACGNGLIGGQPMDCGPETDTSIAIDPAWVKDWITYLVGKFGPSNGRRIYALDNEPNLWSSTHRDVRKSPLGYDELWQRMRDYAVAILEADPTAEIAGPAEWGWPNYLCSDLDDVSQGCTDQSPDRAAHGGTELTAWLLDQAADYEQDNGIRILHYLDLHYYPQGGNNPERTRSLWDPTYTDPSWIGSVIRLVPRMRDWVSGHYPGTKLAVTEYDFYDHSAAVGAVTYAEVLGTFAREGIDLATAWGPPDPSEAAFAAYRLFRNYDGQGGAFESTSVRATVTGSGVTAYAAASATRLTVVLANEGSTVEAIVDVGSFEASGAAQVFQHTGTGGDVTQSTDVALSGSSLTTSLPSESITLLVFEGTNPNPLPDAGSGAGGTGSGGTSAGGSGGNSPGSGGTAAAGIGQGARGGGVTSTGGTDPSSGGTSAGAASGASATSGGTGTAGTSGPSGAGGDASASDTSSGDGGCGCRSAVPLGGTRGALLLLAAMATVGGARRRRLRNTC